MEKTLLQNQLDGKLLSEDELLKVKQQANDGDSLAILNLAIHRLLSENDENGFDILLEEFYGNARRSELKIALFALETLLLNEIHKTM